MKFFLFLFLPFIVVGCGDNTPTNDVSSKIQSTSNALTDCSALPILGTWIDKTEGSNIAGADLNFTAQCKGTESICNTSFTIDEFGPYKGQQGIYSMTITILSEPSKNNCLSIGSHNCNFAMANQGSYLTLSCAQALYTFTKSP